MRESINWQVESLRITVFPEYYSKISPIKLWDEFIDEEPDKVQIERDKFDARHKEFEDRIVALAKQERRINWHYLPKQDESASHPELPEWGNLQAEVDNLLYWSTRWLAFPYIMPVNRLAFGAALMIPTIDPASAYSQLQQLLPDMALENASDFSYQINRRRSSETIEDVQLNRLSRWNVAILEPNQSNLDPAADLEGNTIERAFATRLELDINTVPQGSSALPTESLTSIFEELVQMGLEIASEGDVA